MDILLEVGISVESLKSAQSQINAALASWKTTGTGSDIIDTKNLKANVEEVENQLKNLGNTVGQIGPTAKDNLVKPMGEADNSLKKLAETTAFYNSKAVIMKTSLSDVKAELSSYLKEQSKSGSFDKQIVDLKGKLTTATGEEATAINSQIAALQSAQVHQEQLIGSYKKLSKEQKGFLHGINIPRLLLWAVGWKVMYGALNLVLNKITEVVGNLVYLNETLSSIRVATGKTSATFDSEFNKISDTITSTAYNSRISIKDLTSAFKTLTFESLNTSEATQALSHVRDLMIITGEKEGAVAQALAETYGMYHGKIAGATTASEEFAEISNTLAELFTKAHVTISEYQQIMGYIAPTGAQATESLQFLVNTIIFADGQMLGGRRAAMALSESLIGLTEDTAKLRENFGIVFPYGEAITFEKVLRELRNITKDMNEEARKEYLGKMFKGSTLQLALKLMSASDEKIKSMGDGAGVFADKLAKAMDDAHALEIFFSNIFNTITKTLQDTWQGLNKFAFIIANLGTFLKVPFKHGLLATNEDFMKDVEEARTKQLKQKTQNTAKTPEAIAAATKEAADAALTFQERLAKVELSPALIKDLKIMNRESALSILESSGANKSLIVNEKIGNIIADTSEELFNQETRQKAINALTEARYGTAEEIVRVMKALGIDDVKAEKVALDITKERLELDKQIAEEVRSLADDLQGVTTDFLKDAFSGTVDVSGYLDNIMSTYKDTLAEQLTQIFAEDTGMFASMASSFMSPLQKAHYTGIQNAVPLIIKAHVDGITQGNAESAGSSATGSTSSILGVIKSFFSGEGGGTLLSSISDAVDSISDAMSTTSNTTSESSSAIDDAIEDIATAAGNILTVASFVNSMANASDYQGTGNVVGAASDLGTSGGIAGWVAGGAIGAVIGAAAGAIYGAIQAGTSETTSETEESTIEITSAIEQSNKELSLVNRNLVGLNKGLEGFVLAQSAYFSERTSVEAQFNLDSQRGL